MVVQCPQCGTGHLLEEEDFRGHVRLKLQCTQCLASFVAQAPGDTSESTPPPNVTTDLQHSGLTTVISTKTKIAKGKKIALLVMQGPMKGRIFPVTKPEVVIGRVGTDVVIDDHQVSGKHCALEVRGTSAVLTDLGSTNGIFVGEEPVKSCQLEHLSEFRIGNTTVMFTVTDNE